MKNNKGITLVSLVTTIIVLLILAGISLAIIMSDASSENVSTNLTVKQEICEHEWVITSKYDYFRECYKTISKCSKCGKEVD